jgi:protein-S-isoprenylcysteine O-methyltransferase Ste14
MRFVDIHIPSLGPKLFFSSMIGAATLVSGWLMLADVGAMADWLGVYEIRGDFIRRVTVLSCLVIYFLRHLITLFVFVKRRLRRVETIGVSILMAVVVYAYARIGGSNEQPFGGVEIIGILLYLLGSFINTRSEYARHVWKQKSENKGLLYTAGLFKYSMHINYFGDLVLFTGLSMVCGRVSLLVIPLMMTINFVFVLIPQFDRYLAGKYGDQFVEYAKRTKKLIPKIY